MPQKINVFPIVKRHFSSVLRKTNGRISWTDVGAFIALPVAVGIFCALDVVEISEQLSESAIAVFSIFGALLLSVQIALFGIVQREQSAIRAAKQADMNQRRMQERLELVRELNGNLSFLTIFCVIASSLMLTFILLRIPRPVEVFISVACFLHFALSIIMVIKRAHILFDKEYV